MKKIILILFLIIYIIPCVSFAYDSKLKAQPTYWNGNKWPTDLYNIVTSFEGSALFNERNTDLSTVDTDGGFPISAAECILRINEYAHNTKVETLMDKANGKNHDSIIYSGTPDDLYKVITAALKRYLTKDNIDAMNETLKGSYNEDNGTNKYDTDENGTYIYYNVICQNYVEVAKESIETKQKLRASVGYNKKELIRDGQDASVIKTATKLKDSVSGKSIDFLDEKDEKIGYSKEQIRKYLLEYGEEIDDYKQVIINSWASTIKGTPVTNDQEAIKIISDLCEEIKMEQIEKMTGYTKEELEKMSNENESVVDTDVKEDKDANTVFLQPIGSGNNANGVQDAINDAETFVTTGDKEIISKGNLQEFSQNLYSILLSIGVVVAVLIGAILGVKLMLAPIGERAEAKKLLIPYVVGCIIVFGAFGIWKLAVTIMQGM